MRPRTGKHKARDNLNISYLSAWGLPAFAAGSKENPAARQSPGPETRPQPWSLRPVECIEWLQDNFLSLFWIAEVLHKWFAAYVA